MNQIARESMESLAVSDYERLLNTFRETMRAIQPPQTNDVRSPRALIAFSGGVDSALVLKAACDALGPGNVLAATAASPAVPARELRGARDFAASLGVAFRVVRTRESKQEAYLRNHRDRCFHCKSELYSCLAELARATDCDWLCNGTNTDDLGDVRPGLEAADRAGVRSPLVEAGLNKTAVRVLAKALDLMVWDKPASPCLASRVPFFERISPEILERIERAEDALFALGFDNLRVRHHDTLARVEIPPADFERLMAQETRERIVAALRGAGYRYVTLDLSGLQSGEFNQAT